MSRHVLRVQHYALEIPWAWGEGHDHDRPRMRLNHTRGSQVCRSFFSFFYYFYPQDSVRQRPCPAADLPNSRCNSQGRRKATTNIQVVSITSIKSVLYTILQPTPWRGTCLIVPSLAYRTICIVLHSQQYFLNKQCTFLLTIAFLSYTYVHL